MQKTIEWFTKNSVAANLLMVALVGAGIYSLFNKMILQEFPDFPSREITVTVPYPGSTPVEVEQAIITRLEEELFDVQGIKEMTSVANSGSGTVSLEIEEGYDLSVAADAIKNRVDTIRTFPAEAERAQVSLPERRERAITVVLSGGLSETEMKTLGERVRDEILNLPGVTVANLKAVRPYEISVEVSERQLREYDLSFNSVSNAIRAHSLDLSAGRIKSESGDIMLRTTQQAYSQKDFSEIPILTRTDGTRLTIGDVATVSDGFDETPIVSKFDGERAIAIDVYRTGSQNIIELGTTVKEYLKDLQLKLPEGISADYWRDDSKRIEDRLDTLKQSAVFGYVLVLVVLSLFLRPSLAFWVALGIPISFAGAFFVMPLYGVTMNLITLFAFILVLGIVVDDAIVTGENVYQKMQNGVDSLTASIKGTQEVAVPVIFGVLTTIVAFYPLTLMTGFRGNFFKQVPLVVIPVLLFSLVESKLILPAHLKHLHSFREGNVKRNWISSMQKAVADSLERFVDKFYRPVLHFCLDYRYAVAAIFFGLLAIVTVRIATGHLPFSPFPRIPQDSVTITLEMPVGTSFLATQAVVDKVEAAAIEYKAELEKEYGTEIIDHVFATAGGKPFSSWRSSVGVAELGEIVLELVPSEISGVKVSSREITMKLRAKVGPVPEAEKLEFAFARGSNDVVNVRLSGPRIEELTEASRELQRRLADFPDLSDIEDSFQKATEELELELKPQAEHLGITARQLASQVRQAFFGIEAQRVQRGRDDVKVMVRYPESERKSLAALRSMMIRTDSGLEVPFEEVARVIPGKSLPSIRRFDRNRIITVTAQGDESTVDVEAIQLMLKETILPNIVNNYSGMTFTFEGRAAETADNNAELTSGIYFTLIAIYVLLAIPFRSYVQPLIVMTAIPFGIVGAIFGHEIMDWLILDVLGRDSSPVSFVTMLSLLGMLALSGVVVNDSLVMVDFINQRLKEGATIGEAVREAGPRRFRPILLTSMTTFAGLAPLMFESSTQAQFLIPMAVSLGWGVLFATFITLLLVPVTTLIFHDVGVFFKWLYGKEKEPVETTEAVH